MLTRHPIEFPHVPFRLVPEILDPINVFVLLHKALRMIDAVMFKLGYIQDIIGSVGIRIHDAIWNNPVLHNSH